MKLRPSVAETRVMTEVLSRSVEWYFGSGMSPMKRRIVTHKANAAYTIQHGRWKQKIRHILYFDWFFILPVDRPAFAEREGKTWAVSWNTGEWRYSGRKWRRISGNDIPTNLPSGPFRYWAEWPASSRSRRPSWWEYSARQIRNFKYQKLNQ